MGNSTTRLVLWLIILIIAVLVGIEVVYRNGECCECTKIYETTCGNGEICKKEKKVKDGCCKCSFFKERFGIDLYSWRYDKQN